MNTIQTNYQALVTEENEAPHESVIFHAASEGGKPHWNHIGDLDTFFKNIYYYHQKHGFRCIVIELSKKAIIPLLIIFGFLYIINGINFNFDEPPSPLANKTDIELKDLFLPIPDAVHNFGVWSWIIVVIGIILLLYKGYKWWHTYSTFDDIRQFYNSAMKIDESKVSHTAWHDVQCRLREVQHEQQMCVHKSDLTELDISHRILRNTNYLVAMINKNILPVKYKIKYLGEWVYLTSAFEYILNFIFFSRFSPVFKETGKLSEEFKRYPRRKEAAASLEKFITVLTIMTSFLTIPVLLYSISSGFIKYAGDMKYYPNRLGSRQWSKYGRYYLRHFNELDHELEARLARAYKPANEYMKSFSSPVAVIIARTASRFAGAIAVLFLIWGLVKERLFAVSGVLIIISLCYSAYIALSALIPEENIVYFPKNLMKKIIAEIHYVPDHFKKNAHLPAVREEFSQLFQLKFVSIIEETLSVIFLPYILYFELRTRALDIVDFFRSFTVEVSGVGDVCSFALMDVSKHGNNQWLSIPSKADQNQRAEGGKTELSLIHFTLMNPDWKAPLASDCFINDFRQRVNVARERGQDTEDPYYASLNSLSSMGSRYASLVNSIHFSHHRHPADYYREHCMVNVPDGTDEMGAMSGGLSLVEGPPYLAQGGFLASRHEDLGSSEFQADPSGLNPLEMRAADMSFSALYLHEVHHRLIDTSSSSQVVHPQQPSQETENNSTEASPLLEVQVANYVQ